MKISIIVPLYKAELYVEQCFESISSQTYKNIEIVFVDDGSPDKSGQIADRLSDDNDAFSINVIHKSNGGASSARNAGVNVIEFEGDYTSALKLAREEASKEVRKVKGRVRS